MYKLDMIPILVKSKFGFNPITINNNNTILIKVKGIDNVSLAKYIFDKTENLKITVKGRKCYRFSNDDWIQIELSNKSEIVFIS